MISIRTPTKKNTSIDADYITTNFLFRRLRTAHVRLRCMHGKINQRTSLSMEDRVLLNHSIALVEKAVDLVGMAAGLPPEEK